MSSWIKISAFMLIAAMANAAAENIELRPLNKLAPGYEYPEIVPDKRFDAETVKRGEYLAKIGDCLACHTNGEGAKPYAGGLPLATPFGTFYSPNITPDKETGIGNWTEEQFVRALKEGRTPSGSNYFPVFPYVYFSNLTDADARALYAYFMSIPAVEQKNRPLPFPFNVPGARLSLWGWNLLFFYPNPQPYAPDPQKSPEWNRGQYLVDGLGHCGMCHTPLNVFGGAKNTNYLTGGFINGYWAPNITAKGLATATVEDVTNVFSHSELINRAGAVRGPMAEANNNSLVYLTPEDQRAIAVYLKTVESTDPYEVTPSNEEPNIKRGHHVYLRSCTICHQDGVLGAPVIGNGPGWYTRLQERGLRGLYNHAIDGFNSMPYKGACVTCSDNDVISAVDYLLKKSLTRSQWRDVEKFGVSKFPANGKDIYDRNCSVCHARGNQVNAPAIGDKQIWETLVSKNIDVLIENAIKGKHHPENAGCPKCTTGEIIEAVKYMISQSEVPGNYSLW